MVIEKAMMFVLTLFFGARLAGGAPAFATLVGGMACLGATVVLGEVPTKLWHTLWPQLATLHFTPTS